MTAGSTTAPYPAGRQQGVSTLAWTSWPLVEQPRWSWLAPIGVAVVGVAAGRAAESWLLGAASAAALAVALRQVFLPTRYEIHTSGLFRRARGRTRVVPWHAVRAYQARATGVMLFQVADASAIDALRGMFVPYGPDPDETLVALRPHIAHAVEL